MTTVAMRRPVDGYGDVAVIATENGPAFDGPVPSHIGVTIEALQELAPAVGEWHTTGDLRLLDVWFRHIGVDGPDVFVFEKVTR